MSKRHSLLRAAAAALCVSFLSVPLPAGAAEVSYWDLTREYYAAQDSGDEAAFFAACAKIVDFYAPQDTLEGCERSFPPALKAAAYCEKTGDYDGALHYYTIYRDCLAFIDENSDTDYYDAVRCADAIVGQYAFIDPVVYTLADDPADVPDYGAPYEPQAGTYTGMCARFDESEDSAYLLYAHFGKEELEDFAWMLPQTDTPYLLELAWNIPGETKEELARVAGGSYDSYLIRNLQWIRTLSETPVLLRFAAEVNTWTALPQTRADADAGMEDFCRVYIDAFRHVASLAREYAPNAAMVYSPNDISGWYASPEDFYPGDEYVDWVGISSYMNRSASAANELGSMTDAYYCFGMYDNQLVKIRGIADAFGGKKPILVSECGYCYRSSSSSQSEEYAARKLREFYSCVNMVYPQVKAVLYFNADMNGSRFALSGSSKVRAAYTDAVRQNGAMQAALHGETAGFTRLSTLSEIRSEVPLYVYASYPGHEETEVRFVYDGKELPHESALPYTAVLGKEELTPGRHELTVTVRCKKTEKTVRQTLYVGENGFVSAGISAADDIGEEDWAYVAVQRCMQEGLLGLYAENRFSPNAAVTRAVLREALLRLAEQTSLHGELSGILLWDGEHDDTPVTETELRTALYRFCRAASLSPEKTGPASPYKNDADIPEDVREEVYFARRAGLCREAESAHYRGQKAVPRARLAYALSPLLDALS